MLRYLTAGETHGKCLTAIIEGIPSGIKIDVNKINDDLAARQKGHGRGGRMAIEKDTVQILSGIRGGYTLGSPIALLIENKDWKNWQEIMGSEQANGEKSVIYPRPGHADLSGGLKYNHKDLRNVLERASARETAVRVAVGSIAKQLLSCFNITFLRRVAQIGDVCDIFDAHDSDFYKKAGQSPVGFGNKDSEQKAVAYIDQIKEKGESCGGIVEITINGMPPGIGSYVHYDRKLDARLAFSVMSVQAIKGVEIGMGFDCAVFPGSNVHDEIQYHNGFSRYTNHAGGIEGGMSNGEPIIIRAAMKPIPTLYTPLRTVDITDKSEHKATVERSDACAVPACSVVVEAAAAFETAKAFLETFGGDCLTDLQNSYDHYLKRISEY